jgi:DUF4097 and DUF4098 domain-containing protein YvlB
MKTFLENLRKELNKQALNDVEIADIMNDHKEMISQAMEEGLTEDQIAEKFGDPKTLAEELGKPSSTDESDEPEETTENTIIESFSKENIKAIEFKLIHEDIIVEPSSNDKVELHGVKINQKLYKIYEKAGTIHIERKNNMGIKFRIIRDRNETFTLKIPTDFELELLDIKTKSSDVKIDSLKADTLEIKTISGDLSLNNVTVKESNIKAISADFNIESSQFEQLNISNVSGDYKIEKTKINGPLVVSSVSGNIIVNSSETKDVTYRTVSGDLVGTEFYPESLSLKSISGDININNKDYFIGSILLR